LSRRWSNFGWWRRIWRSNGRKLCFGLGAGDQVARWAASRRPI
jgi:hypothetical protein